MNHDSDGTKKITISTSFKNSGTTIAGTYSASKTVTLDTIKKGCLTFPVLWTLRQASLLPSTSTDILRTMSTISPSKWAAMWSGKRKGMERR